MHAGVCLTKFGAHSTESRANSTKFGPISTRLGVARPHSDHYLGRFQPDLGDDRSVLRHFDKIWSESLAFETMQLRGVSPQLGREFPIICLFWTQVGKLRAKCGQASHQLRPMRPNLGKIRARPDRTMPTLAKTRPNCRPKLLCSRNTKSGQTWSKLLRCSSPGGAKRERQQRKHLCSTFHRCQIVVRLGLWASGTNIAGEPIPIRTARRGARP